MDALKIIGTNVHKHIREQGYRSVELFAHEHGLDQSVLSRLIRGKTGITVTTLIRIAEALELTLNDLYAPTIPGKAGLSHPRVASVKKGERTSSRKMTLQMSDIDRIILKRSDEKLEAIVLEIKRTKGKST